MKTAYPEAMTFPAGHGTAPELAALIDETIKRFTTKRQFFRLPPALRFPRKLEAVYEAETKQARVSELHFTQTTAICFVGVSTITDPVFIPDVTPVSLILLFMGAAALAIAIFLFRRVSSRMREMSLFGASYAVLNVIICIPCLSRNPNAILIMVSSFLVIIFVNTTTPFRFAYAVSFTLLSMATIAIYLHFDPMVTPTTDWILMLLGAVGTSFSLFGNYRIERSARLGYLLASKEALRLFAMNRAREDMATLSGTDALTGIANRGDFDRRLAALFDGNAALGTAIHMIMLDVDFFKRFNDRYGHPGGDACLRAIAAVLTRAVREKADFVFRYGGEEFGALLLDTSQERAEEIAERIRGSVQETAIEHLNREDGLNVVTVSVGVAHAVIGDGSTADSLIERADLALYASKHGGRNRVSLSR